MEVEVMIMKRYTPNLNFFHTFLLVCSLLSFFMTKLSSKASVIISSWRVITNENLQTIQANTIMLNKVSRKKTNADIHALQAFTITFRAINLSLKSLYSLYRKKHSKKIWPRNSRRNISIWAIEWFTHDWQSHHWSVIYFYEYPQKDKRIVLSWTSEIQLAYLSNIPHLSCRK